METLDEFAASARPAAGAVSDLEEAYYTRLVQDFGDWRKPELSDATVRDACRALLEREARLLEGTRGEEGFALVVVREHDGRRHALAQDPVLHR